MDATMRNDLVKRLGRDDRFAAATSNAARVAHVLDHVMPYERLREAVSAEIGAARRRSRKSLSRAKAYFATAKAYYQQQKKANQQQQQQPKASNHSSIIEALHQAIRYVPNGSVRARAKLYEWKAAAHYDDRDYCAAYWAADIAYRCGNVASSSDTNKSRSRSDDNWMIRIEILRILCLRKLFRMTEAAEAVERLISRQFELCKQSAKQSSFDSLLDRRSTIEAQIRSSLLGEAEQDEDDELSIENYARLRERWIKSARSQFNSNTMIAIENEEDHHQIGDDDLMASFVLDSAAISITSAPIVGRHFVARREIAADQVLLHERPISIVMEHDYLGRKCSACQRELEYRFFPCADCVDAVYCGSKCAERARTDYHAAECGGLQRLLRSITSPCAHVFKMIASVGGPAAAFRIQRDHAQATYSIDQYLADSNTAITTMTRFTKEDYAFHDDANDLIDHDDDDVYRDADDYHRRVTQYRMAATLWHHDSKHGAESNAYHTVIALETVAILEHVYCLSRKPHESRINIDHLPQLSFDANRSMFASQKSLIDLTAMVIVDIRRIVFNVFGWHEYSATTSSGSDVMTWSVRGHVANCQCLVGSLINHSCAPNTAWEWRDGRIYFTAKRVIRAGEQITITYGPGRDQSYRQRQQRLNNYFFACTCDACYRDACAGNVLRCRACPGSISAGSGPGPVVFDSAVNAEPQLSGRCLRCYQPYAQFTQTIRELTRRCADAKTLRAIARAGPMIVDGDDNDNDLHRQYFAERICCKAIEIIDRLIDLSLIESEPIIRAIFDCSAAIEFVIAANLIQLPLSDRITEFAVRIDRSLPLTIPSMISGNGDDDADDDDAARSIRFWCVSLREWLHQFQRRSKSPPQPQDEDQCRDPKSTDTFEDVLHSGENALLRFHYRLRALLKSFISHREREENVDLDHDPDHDLAAANSAIQQIVAKQFKKLDYYLEAYRGGRSRSPSRSTDDFAITADDKYGSFREIRTYHPNIFHHTEMFSLNFWLQFIGELEKDSSSSPKINDTSTTTLSENLTAIIIETSTKFNQWIQPLHHSSFDRNYSETENSKLNFTKFFQNATASPSHQVFDVHREQDEHVNRSENFALNGQYSLEWIVLDSFGNRTAAVRRICQSDACNLLSVIYLLSLEFPIAALLLLLLGYVAICACCFCLCNLACAACLHQRKMGGRRSSDFDSFGGDLKSDQIPGRKHHFARNRWPPLLTIVNQIYPPQQQQHQLEQQSTTNQQQQKQTESFDTAADREQQQQKSALISRLHQSSKVDDRFLQQQHHHQMIETMIKTTAAAAAAATPVEACNYLDESLPFDDNAHDDRDRSKLSIQVTRSPIFSLPLAKETAASNRTTNRTISIFQRKSVKKNVMKNVPIRTRTPPYDLQQQQLQQQQQQQPQHKWQKQKLNFANNLMMIERRIRSPSNTIPTSIVLDANAYEFYCDHNGSSHSSTNTSSASSSLSLASDDKTRYIDVQQSLRHRPIKRNKKWNPNSNGVAEKKMAAMVWW